jgi:putrescine transport system permease protein
MTAPQHIDPTAKRFSDRIRWAERAAARFLAQGSASRRRFDGNAIGRWLVIAVPYAWLALFFLVPFLIILKIALAKQALAVPPYEPLLVWADGKLVTIKITIANFLFVAGDGVYLKALGNSIVVAAISTALALLIAYPLAYAMARATPARRNILLMLVVLPFWTSFLLRVYAWIGLLKNNGLINNFLIWTGVIDEPMALLQTNFSMYLGMVQCYLPFMVLPLYAQLEKMDLTLLEAAADLGCRPTKAFFKITLPLSMPGVVAGCMLVFIPCVGEYVIPELLGGPNSLMIGRVLWSEFFDNRDWPVASAIAVVLLIALVVPMMFFQRARSEQDADGVRA